MKWAVIDDHGDEWEQGQIVFTSDILSECLLWAESENYHSASIVSIDENGKRLKWN